MTRLTPATLATIASTPQALRALVGSLPPEALEAQDAGGWSVRQVVAHLLDSALRQRLRVTQMLEVDDPEIPDMDELASLQASGFLERSVGSLLIDLERERRADLERWRAFGEMELARPGQHSAAGPITIGQVINHAAYHDLLHLRQIAGILARVAHEGRGGFQQFDPPED